MPEAGEVKAFDKPFLEVATGSSLGVKFKVEIPIAIRAQVSGFSIVRAERKAADETMVGQGLMMDTNANLFTDGSGNVASYIGRCERVDNFGGGGMVTGLHTLHIPRLLLGDREKDLKGFKVRPIVAVEPAASRVMDITGKTDNDPNPGQGRDKFRWTKYLFVRDPNHYFKDYNTVDNIKSLSFSIDESAVLPAQTIATATHIINDPIYTIPGFTYRGFTNFGIPHGSDDDIDSGSNQQAMRARGGWAHTIRADRNSVLNTYYSAVGNTVGTQNADSRILSSTYYIGDKTLLFNGPGFAVTQPQRKLLVNLYRELDSQYGGDSKSDIENTEYISTGHFQAVLDTDISNIYEAEVFGGDTYVCVYDESTLSANNTSGAFSNFEFPAGDNEALGEGSVFVVESKLNLDWRRGIHMNNMPSTTYPTTNLFTFTDNPDLLSTPTDVLADWNSRQNDAVTFLTLSSFSNVTDEWDNRIWASEAKTNGEPLDSWTTFKVNDIMDVDGNLGPINKLETFNDDVYYFQDKGFGKAIINPNPVIQGSDDITLALGTGKVLHDFKYISTNVGTKHQWSVFTSPNAIYWFDILQKKPYTYTRPHAKGGGTREMSDVKGMHSFFMDNVDNYLLAKDSPSLRTGIRGAYDFLNNEALFTFLNSKTTYGDTAASYTEFASTLVGGAMPEGSLVEYDVSKNILDDSGNTIATVNVKESHDVIQTYNISATELIPTANRTTAFLRKRPTYLQSDFTMAFSEPAAAWTTFYDFSPSIYINTKARLVTPNANYSKRMHLHNEGAYNKFYGDGFNSVLEILTNTAPDQTKVYDNVTWYTNAKSKSGARGKTFDQITFGSYYCYNDYQHSGIITLDPTVTPEVLRKVEREWQAPIPRNIVTQTGTDIDILNPANWDAARTFNDRMRDKYLIQHFEYDGTQSDQFVINYINTYVRTSDR